MELSKNLLNRCKEKGITIKALSRLSGVSQRTLHGWSTGRSVQNLSDLRKVCSVLEISIHKLLFGSPDPFEMKQEDMIEEFIWGSVKIVMYKIK